MRLRTIQRGLVAMLVVALAFNPLVSAANAFSFDDNWEEKFRSIPKAENLREYMRRLSAEPHHLGSAAGKRNAEWMRDQLNAWGWKAQLEEFDVLFPTPKERVLELVSPEKFLAKL
jgi:N-acetylated-alpha-linked acidic dipeptidase